MGIKTLPDQFSARGVGHTSKRVLRGILPSFSCPVKLDRVLAYRLENGEGADVPVTSTDLSLGNASDGLNYSGYVTAFAGAPGFTGAPRIKVKSSQVLNPQILKSSRFSASKKQ
jgi:hypothetical protein